MAGSVPTPVLGRARRFARGLIDAAFPLACAACDDALGDDALPLCAVCRASLVDCGPAFCLACVRTGGAPLRCTRRDHRRLRAGFTWSEPVRAVVHAFKFGDVPGLAGPLVAAAWDTPAFAERPRPDLVVPVPLHPRRRRERGYDQAEALARAFATRTGGPLVRGLERVRSTRQQARLEAAARATNLAGAFRPAVAGADALAGRHVALVDDVVTTGATVHAARDALVAAGAQSVEAWCVAYEPLE